MAPTTPAIALGSSQPEAEVDAVQASRLGLAVVRRRSGGGAVLIVPGNQLWVEFLIPRGDSLWDDDVVRAADWAGAVWAEALESLGVAGLSVHHGRMVETRWSGAVCFAGLGPSEVVTNGRKAIGLSQRRNRGWTRIQTMVHRVWQPELLVGALAMAPREREECLDAVSNAVASVDFDAAAVVETLLTKLPE